MFRKIVNDAFRFYFPWQHRLLVWQFTRKEVLGRYRGSALGLGWSFVTPLLMLCVYTFVFVGVFKARWPGAESGGGVEFALQIFVGLMVFNFFAEVASRAPVLVVEQPNLVKKVVFPLDILSWISVLSGAFHLFLSSLVLLVALILLRNASLGIYVLALPFVLASMLPLLLGIGWLLSALGVYVRDVGQIMGFVVNFAMFLSPVFYSEQSVSGFARKFMGFNPLSIVITNARKVLLDNTAPDWGQLSVLCFVSCMFALVAGSFFRMTRGGFADVL